MNLKNLLVVSGSLLCSLSFVQLEAFAGAVDYDNKVVVLERENPHSSEIDEERVVITAVEHNNAKHFEPGYFVWPNSEMGQLKIELEAELKLSKVYSKNYLFLSLVNESFSFFNSKLSKRANALKAFIESSPEALEIHIRIPNENKACKSAQFYLPNEGSSHQFHSFITSLLDSDKKPGFFSSLRKKWSGRNAEDESHDHYQDFNRPYISAVNYE